MVLRVEIYHQQFQGTIVLKWSLSIQVPKMEGFLYLTRLFLGVGIPPTDPLQEVTNELLETHVFSGSVKSGSCW